MVSVLSNTPSSTNSSSCGDRTPSPSPARSHVHNISSPEHTYLRDSTLGGNLIISSPAPSEHSISNPSESENNNNSNIYCRSPVALPSPSQDSNSNISPESTPSIIITNSIVDSTSSSLHIIPTQPNTTETITITNDIKEVGEGEGEEGQESPTINANQEGSDPSTSP